MKQNKRFITGLILGVFLTLLITLPLRSLVSAEQSGTTPNSGATSYIKQLYDSLVSLGNGSDSSGSWGDWGGMWNRIRSSSEWVPSGDATAGDVVMGRTFYGDGRAEQIGTLAFTGDATVDDVFTGKTFYSDSLTKLTGMGPEPIDFSLQQFSERDNYAGAYYTGVGPEDYQGEESEWTDHSVDADTVWKDERTSVYWSADRGVLTTNNFAAISTNLCSYFDEDLYMTRAEYPGGDTDCGDAINYCATLDYGGRTDWYLPSQQELMMAYIDGMYNQAGATPEEAAAFTYGTTSGGGYRFWSSSEVSNLPTYAYYVYLFNGLTSVINKTTANAVRCVARD